MSNVLHKASFISEEGFFLQTMLGINDKLRGGYRLFKRRETNYGKPKFFQTRITDRKFLLQSHVVVIVV